MSFGIESPLEESPGPAQTGRFRHNILPALVTAAAFCVTCVQFAHAQPTTNSTAAADTNASAPTLAPVSNAPAGSVATGATNSTAVDLSADADAAWKET